MINSTASLYTMRGFSINNLFSIAFTFIILLSVSFIAIFSVENYDASQPKKPKTIEETLKLIAENKLDITPLNITYDDFHGFHGGLTISIKGDGSITQKAIHTSIAPAINLVSNKNIHGLIELLIKEKMWLQVTPPRTAIPDETTARLFITYDVQTSEVWEWFNDMVDNDRMIKIKEYMITISTKK